MCTCASTCMLCICSLALLYMRKHSTTHFSTYIAGALHNQGAGRRAKQRGERVLERTLDARQFALKMISNVTYGYTAAGFSGHMPMAELADAIVECGRATLENAIRYHFN
jgi:DNA polymerase family B